MTTVRSKWPAARHVRKAADQLRARDPNLANYQQEYFAVVAAKLDEAALDLAWLAPFREHEGGFRLWRHATRMAHGLLGLPDADGCGVCHTHRPTECTWIPGDAAPSCDWDKDCPAHGWSETADRGTGS